MYTDDTVETPTFWKALNTESALADTVRRNLDCGMRQWLHGFVSHLSSSIRTI